MGMPSHDIWGKIICDYQNHVKKYFSDFQYFLKKSPLLKSTY